MVHLSWRVAGGGGRSTPTGAAIPTSATPWALLFPAGRLARPAPRLGASTISYLPRPGRDVRGGPGDLGDARRGGRARAGPGAGRPRPWRAWGPLPMVGFSVMVRCRPPGRALGFGGFLLSGRRERGRCLAGAPAGPGDPDQADGRGLPAGAGRWPWWRRAVGAERRPSCPGASGWPGRSSGRSRSRRARPSCHRSWWRRSRSVDLPGLDYPRSCGSRRLQPRPGGLPPDGPGFWTGRPRDVDATALTLTLLVACLATAAQAGRRRIISSACGSSRGWPSARSGPRPGRRTGAERRWPRRRVPRRRAAGAEHRHATMVLAARGPAVWESLAAPLGRGPGVRPDGLPARGGPASPPADRHRPDRHPPEGRRSSATRGCSGPWSIPARSSRPGWRPRSIPSPTR